jgi:xanthine/CO dehydrogenase XdhC/CoxF family maturation factor
MILAENTEWMARNCVTASCGADVRRLMEPAPTAAVRAVRLDTSVELMLERSKLHIGERVLATIVATAGSTYRKAGARMLVMADGTYLGLLSGGCFEADLIVHAKAVLENGAARLLEYDMRNPDDVVFGIGAGCEGAMLVLLERAGSDSRAERALAQSFTAPPRQHPPLLITIYESCNWPLGTYRGAELPSIFAATADHALAESRSRNIVVEFDGRLTLALAQSPAPAPRLLICGGGPDAQPVANAAVTLGWQVLVLDHRPTYAMKDRFPGAEARLIDFTALSDTLDVSQWDAAVIMSHHLESDVRYIRALADAKGPRYVGLLGPTARRNRVVHALGSEAAGIESRLHGPVGLDIGAVTPESIALAIVSEIHAWLAGREARCSQNHRRAP